MATHGTVARNELMTHDVAVERGFLAATLGHTFEEMPMADGRTCWLIRSGSEMVGGILALSGDEMSGVLDGWFTYRESR